MAALKKPKPRPEPYNSWMALATKRYYTHRVDATDTAEQPIAAAAPKPRALSRRRQQLANIDLDDLRTRLSYSPETGEVKWVGAEACKKVGYIVECPAEKATVTHRYRYMYLCGMAVGLSHIVWALTHGRFPRQIRFENGDTMDLRLSNLTDGRRLTLKP